MNNKFFWYSFSLIILISIACFISLFTFSRKSLTTSFKDADPKSDFGPIETINGIPFLIENGAVKITEQMAHIRVPHNRTKLGKELKIKLFYKLSDADIVEIGIRKSSFWLDYQRIPVKNKVLDQLSKKGWKIIPAGDANIFVNPKLNYKNASEFFGKPPDGLLGLYGNTSFNCDDLNKKCITSPFQATDRPEDFSAIYAKYTPNNSNEFETSFDLSNSYQNSDGSFDLMLFAKSAKTAFPTYEIEKIEATVEPSWLSLKSIINIIRNEIRPIIFRNK